MGTIIEDLDDHEGYGARRLPDGTLTATWSAGTARFSAYVAACCCRWHGGEHPPTDEGYESAVDEWERDHARPLLAETVPASVVAAIKDAKQAIGRLARERPSAALRVIEELGSWVAVTGDRLGDPVPEAASRMRHRLDGLAEPEPRRRAPRR